MISYNFRMVTSVSVFGNILNFVMIYEKTERRMPTWQRAVNLTKAMIQLILWLVGNFKVLQPRGARSVKQGLNQKLHCG
jgi:hypothetical protein